ncbi:hypothetical protein ABE504_25205 [Paenibacillus oryzisoli]|uniref:hypothetical protein n=1 Tax=Paenibacillus oryzisoli TaxID=1850517 RepID=UPI003D2D620A
MRANINVTVKTVEHPEQSNLTNLWANLILKEILRRESQIENVQAEGDLACGSTAFAGASWDSGRVGRR